MSVQSERTFIMVKPDGVQRGLVGEIIKRFEQKGFKLVAMKMATPTKAQLEEHYAEHKGKPFLPKLLDYMLMGPVVQMVWEGSNVILTGRKMMGKTKPLDSDPGTIRGDFAIDSGRNVIHGSDGIESAKREIDLWFKPTEVFDHKLAAHAWIYE